MRRGWLCVSEIIFVISLALLSLSTQGIAADACIEDDAFHYTSNGIDDQLYNEWWRFNAVCSQTQFSIGFLLSDPENITGLRRIQVLAVSLDGPPAVGIQQSRGYGADRKNPSFEIDKSGFVALNDSTYRVYGSAKDIETGVPMEWDLIYQTYSTPWLATPVPTHVGSFTGGSMKWLVYMPSARVKGAVTVKGQTNSIEATGYHDHMWGRWAFNDPQWSRLQVSSLEDDFSLALWNIRGEETKSFMRINYGSKTLTFRDGQIKLVSDDFSMDFPAARMYPIVYKVSADNGEYQLEMAVKVLKSTPVVFNYPKAVPSYVIFEQLSQYSGTLKLKGVPIYRLNQTGFAEYTTHKLHPLYGRINAPYPRNMTVSALNERTGQTKTAEPSTAGYFSIDANYADYMANKASPWIADGDHVTFEFKNASGKLKSGSVIVNITLDGQMVDIE